MTKLYILERHNKHNGHNDDNLELRSPTTRSAPLQSFRNSYVKESFILIPGRTCCSCQVVHIPYQYAAWFKLHIATRVLPLPITPPPICHVLLYIPISIPSTSTINSQHGTFMLLVDQYTLLKISFLFCGIYVDYYHLLPVDDITTLPSKNRISGALDIRYHLYYFILTPSTIAT